MWPTGCPETSIITTTRRVITQELGSHWLKRSQMFKIIKPLSISVLTSQHYPYCQYHNTGHAHSPLKEHRHVPLKLQYASIVLSSRYHISHTRNNWSRHRPVYFAVLTVVKLKRNRSDINEFCLEVTTPAFPLDFQFHHLALLIDTQIYDSTIKFNLAHPTAYFSKPYGQSKPHDVNMNRLHVAIPQIRSLVLDCYLWRGHCVQV